jgi:F-type H+-transporting ATPase subunit delta
MSAVARRYAKALFHLAREANQLEQVADELDQLVTLVTSPELAPVWNNPLLNAQERREIVAVLQRQLGFSDLLGRFLSYLADHKRLRELPAIRQVYQQLLDEAAGRTRARIVSALPLSPEQVERLVQFLERRTGKKVLAETVTDPSLLGGFLVEAEGKVYDASVTNQLALLAARLGAGTSH